MGACILCVNISLQQGEGTLPLSSEQKASKINLSRNTSNVVPSSLPLRQKEMQVGDTM